MWKLILFMCLLSHKSIGGAQGEDYQKYLKLRSVKLFQEYLQIDTSKEENIEDAVDFWKREFSASGIPYVVYRPAGLPIVVATIKGSKPTLPSIMLNSHMDVVYADPSEWTYPPFDAHMDEKGDIYGRGAQDTKDIAIQYLEAIRRLKKQNVTLARTVHITLIPVEETGGARGLEALIKSNVFKTLNVGFALDEGLPNPKNDFFGTYMDKRPWIMNFTLNGVGGHGYQMPDNSTMEKMQKFINAVMKYRAQQKQIVRTGNPYDFGAYSSCNINIIRGGVVPNVIPTKMWAVIDMRLSPNKSVAEMEAVVKSWMDAVGNGIEVTYLSKDIESPKTPTDDTNPFWVSMKDTLNDMNMTLVPIVFPATSNMRSIRILGIPAIGFTTKINTIPRLHNKDEYQNVKIFLKGICIYTEVIKNIANVL